MASGNPFAGPEDAAVGARIFRSRCASCHGLEGSGSASGSDLTTGTFRQGASDEALYRTIAKGIPGTAMLGSALNGREIWQLVAFVRSLSIGKEAERAKGDAARGARLFETQGCVKCHAVSGKGSYQGPDLGEIGSRRRLAELERSVLDPNAEVAPDYWSLRARTKGGETVTGIRLNEDTYSFQVLTSQGRLMSLLKEDLAGHEMIRTSPMPSFQGKLQRAEVQDLVAYLASLRASPEKRGREE